MRRLNSIAALVLALLLGTSFCISHRAQANMPKRVAKPLSVLLKTTAYGTATGAVFGVGIAALSGGGPKTFGKVTSLGMYAGILVGMYILLAPPEMIYNSPENQKNDEDDGHKPKRWPGGPDEEEQSQAVPGPRDTKPSLWLPVVTTHF